MKKFIQFICVLFFLTNSLVFGQCGANNVNPSPQLSGVCQGSPQTVTFAGFGTCAGTYQFQVSVGGNVVQAWSNSATYAVTPTSTATYTVSVRCSACPLIVATDTFTIEVINQPIVPAIPIVCHGTSTSLTAVGAPGTVTWWNASTAGTQLSTNENYTTPVLTSNQTYYVQATGTISGGSNQGSILISECGLEGFPGDPSADYIEVSNLYSNSVNTAGWVVAVSNSYTALNSVNPVVWNLPSSFTPCSMLSRTDVSGQPNYWGNNIFWNATSKSWAIIIDNNGNVIDFIAWGWTAAELAGFNATINGFNVTLGPQWIGAGCPLPCQTTAGVAYSFSRTGNSDNNVATDFTCQATSLNTLNAGLTCGWVSSNIACRYPVNVIVDLPPTASTPPASSYQCMADVPAANPSVVTTELDDYTAIPTVQFLGEVSSGTTCPVTLTRTYRVLDSCANYVDVTHTITVDDNIAPVLTAAPADITVTCYADVPSMNGLNWTDNCSGSGTSPGVEVSNGLSCPETLTRTWTITDACGNTATESQSILIYDDIAPVLSAAPTNLTLQCYADVPPMNGLNWTDNCDGTGIVAGVEVTNGLTCPETLTRTWSYTDGCGNTATETQTIVIHDNVAPVLSSGPANLTVQCYSDVPVMGALNWTDNCDGSGVLAGVEVSDGLSCPETLTRTWSYTDGCGNTSTETQTIVIHDVTAPTASNLPTLQVAVLPAPDVNLINDEADNCGTPTVTWISDQSNNAFCPEIIVRTYSIEDDCGNETFITQNFTVGDPFPDVSFQASVTNLTNLSSGLVDFTNTSTGAVSYVWDFGDNSPTDTDVNPSHEFNNDESAGYVVELIGYSEFGCTDTFSLIVSVREELLYFVPNTFTPDGDEFNQTFKPIFESGFDVYDYHMSIYNRWGELIFESFNHEIGWDGTYNGSMVQEGTYVWKIEFGVEYNDERKTFTGNVNLIR